MIRVRSLGGCEIQIGRKRITLTTEVPFALAFYLAQRAGEQLTRDELAETFWGSRDPAKARHSLRQTLYKLRQKGFPLDEGAEEVLLDAALVESDVARVLSAEWPSGATAEEVEAAGEFLPGLTRRMAPGIMEWLDALRSQVAGAHRRGALAQIVRARREARWADLERWAHQVLQSDPLNEEATFARAESAAMAGSKAAALEILDAYMAELGDHAPKISLPASVLRRRIAERQPEWVQRGPREVALIGRAELMGRLTGFVEEAARGHGGGVLLWGAPGVGKTRLASELAVFAELEGFRVVRLRASLPDRRRPLSTVLTLVPALTSLPGAAGAHPSTNHVLTRVQRDFQVAVPEPALGRAADGTEIIASLLDLLEALSSEVRLLILIDDAHNLDDQSNECISELILQSRELRTLWLLTSRPIALRDDGFSVSLLPARRLAVSPLDLKSSRDLIEATTSQFRTPLSEEHVSRIADVAAGIPLFLRELSHHRSVPLTASDLPQSLYALIDDRLAQLPATSIRLLQVVGRLGGLATIGRVARFLRWETDALSAALASLEAEGILGVSPQNALSLHECWQQVVEERTPRSVSVALAHELAHALLDGAEDPDDIGPKWLAADLLSFAGETRRASLLRAEVGDQYFGRGLIAEAERAYRRAREDSRAASTPLILLAAHVRALYGLERLEEVESECARALRTSSAATDDELIALATLTCLRLEGRVRSKADHREALEAVARVAADTSMPEQARLLACFAGLAVVLNDKSSELEDALFKWSEETCAALASVPTLGALVGLMYGAERGDSALVAKNEELLRSREHERRSEPFACRILRIRSTAQRWIGSSSAALALAARAYELAIQQGSIGEAATACELLTFTALDAGELSVASDWMSRWSDARPERANSERNHARMHALARLRISHGDYAGALECYRSEEGRHGWELLEKRRATDEAALALCFAMTGNRADSVPFLQRCREALAASQPTPLLDFVADSTVSALAAIGETDAARATRNSYLSRRNARLPVPVAAGHRALRAPDVT